MESLFSMLESIELLPMIGAALLLGLLLLIFWKAIKAIFKIGIFLIGLAILIWAGSSIISYFS